MNYPNGHEFENRMLYPSQIKFDPLYQRDLDSRRAAKIAAEFDGDIFNEPKVSYRDGVYWCFNGQHSIAAWKILHNNKDIPVNCKVFKGMTWTEECDAFVKQNGIDKDPTTNERLRALYNAKNPDVVSMVNIATLCGFICDFATGQIRNRIVCTSTLFKAYKALGAEAFQDMLTCLHESWNGEIDSTSNQIISGLAAFYKTYYGNFKRADLVKALNKITPAEIIRNGRNYINKRNSYAKEILKRYNTYRRNGKFEDKL